MVEQNDNIRPFWKSFGVWFKSKTSLDVTVMPARQAYCKTTYGCEMRPEYVIKMHQQQINKLISNKTQYHTNGDLFADYRCVYSFPTDSIPYIDEVLKPFRDAGYTVINLSEKVDELKNDHVYLISWYKENL